jgi:hypothetical protein
MKRPTLTAVTAVTAVTLEMILGTLKDSAPQTNSTRGQCP